jgi:hypothetical protein
MMPSDTGDVSNIFSKHLDSRGDGTGVIDATGFYADSVVTFDNTSNIVTLASHGFAAGDGPFQFTTTGSLPAELALLTDYYVGPTVNAGSFEVSLTRGGAAVPFTDDGTATTTIETPFRFYCEAQTGEVLRVARLLVHIEDATVWSAANYGNLASALTVGITVHTEDANGNTIIDLTDVAVKSNADWGRFCYDVAYVAFGAGNDFLQARWTFERSGMPIRLDTGERLVVTVNDDMDGLDAHCFVIQGYNELS